MAQSPYCSAWAGWLVWILSFGLGEETSWRGFALPRLQKEHSARSAAVIAGLLWAGWHLPAFFCKYQPTAFGIIAFLVGILSGSALLAWLYNSTGGSILAAIVWHGTYNAAVAEGWPLASALVTATVILAVVFIANRYRPEKLSPRQRHVLPPAP